MMKSDTRLRLGQESGQERPLESLLQSVNEIVSESEYHSLVESLPLQILRKDTQGRVVFGNKKYCDAMNKPLAELLGKTDFDIFPAELAKKYVEDDRRGMETGKLMHAVEAHRTRDGDDIQVEVLKGPVVNADGQTVGIQIMFWDVTDRKRAQA